MWSKITLVRRLLRENPTKMPDGPHEGALVCKMVWIPQQRVYLNRCLNQAIDITLRKNIVLCLRLRQECLENRYKKKYAKKKCYQS